MKKKKKRRWKSSVCF